MSEELEDVATDTSVEVEEATDSNENSEQEDTVALKEKAEKAEQFARTAIARAKKAEEELKALKANPPIKNDPQLSDELKLIARGLSDEEIDKAKVIAKGNGTTLNEALKDDMFIAYQKKLKEDKRKEDAKLGASKGSGESEDSTLIKTEMTRDEHQQAFKKLMGQ
jgi:hypothetical protein